MMEIEKNDILAFVSPAWLLAALAPLGFLIFGALRAFLSTLQNTTKAIYSSYSFSHARLNWRLNTACILVAFSLARPYIGETTITLKSVNTSRFVLIALDVSRSMLVDDVRPNRLERAKMLIRSLLEPLAGEQVGLILFAGSAFLQCPMSSDHDVLREMLHNLGPDFIPRGGTNYEKMLQTALSAFPEDSESSCILIIMSDGEAHEDSWRKHIPAITKRGVSVITVGIGTTEGGLVPSHSGGFEKHFDGRPVLSRLEPSTLQELASATGGIYLDASQWVDLAIVVSEVESRRAISIQRQKNITQKNDAFHWPLLAAVILVAWALVTEVPVHPARRKLRRHMEIATFTQKTILSTRSMLQKKNSSLSALLFLTSLFFPDCILSESIGAQNKSITQQPVLSSKNECESQQHLSPEEARARLLETVKNLSKTGLSTSAHEYERFAKETLAYLEPAAKQLPPSTIRSLVLDGLDAVRRGSIRAPNATNWDELRQKLKHWLDQDPPQNEHDEIKENDNPQHQSQNNSHHTKQQKNSNANSTANKNEGSSEQNQDTHSQSNEQSSAGDEQENQPPSSQLQTHSNKTHSAQTSENKDNAVNQKNDQVNQGPLGDRPLKEDGEHTNQSNLQQTAPTPVPKPRPTQLASTQRIGGKNIKQTDQSLESLPRELREALMMLEQARQNDRPAVLFERLIDKDKEQPEEGKNW